MKPILVVQGASRIDDVPRLGDLRDQAEIRFANSTDELRAVLPGADTMLGWNFRADSLREAWDSAQELRWIHWCGAGVDAAMFPELVQSAVQLTNARGIFDRPMAEWVLGMILGFAKRFPQTLEFQLLKEWNHRLSETIEGKRALVVRRAPAAGGRHESRWHRPQRARRRLRFRSNSCHRRSAHAFSVGGLCHSYHATNP
jgi:phosphoglycerate dehydrogenase-like enzyme